MKGTVAKDMLHGADREIPERVIKRPFASVPFISEYEEPLTNSISVQQISRSAPCNISFASVPFFLEYEEPLTNSISVQQISRSAPCNISFATVAFISEYGLIAYLFNRFPDPLRVTYLLHPFLSF
jgi:hypothetical protein